MTPIPDYVAFGDPSRPPRCAQLGPEIANLFTSAAAGALKDARRVCRTCPLGPSYPGDTCASWRLSWGPRITAGMVCGGRWFGGVHDG